MKNLKIRTDGKAVKTMKQLLLLISLSFIAIFAIVSRSGLTATPATQRILQTMRFSGSAVLIALILTTYLLSRYSIVKSLKVRKKLIIFTRMFLHSKEDGIFLHSVRWKYDVKDGKIIAELYPNGLEKDTADIGWRLAQNLDKTLLKYEEFDGKARYVFGCTPQPFKGKEKMAEGIDEATGGLPSYEPIPIYDGVEWDFASEALHILLIAPSGAGKTYFLTYLGGMILNRRHRLYVIDAKNSDFGMTFRHAGVPVATKKEEMIQILTELVREMENRYSQYSADDSCGTDFQDMGMPWHILIFDEILSVLSSVDKKDKAELERLLGQIALKGRAAGIAIIITAQKLNATDLPKAITEQCQTRIVLGRIVSDETFHQATGMYKKDIGTVYKGDVGKGYTVTPKTGGLSYIETPRLPRNLRDCLELLVTLNDRGYAV